MYILKSIASLLMPVGDYDQSRYNNMLIPLQERLDVLINPAVKNLCIY